MKLLFVFIISAVCMLAQEKDSLLVKQLDKQISGKDSLLSFLQKVILKDAYDKNILIQVDNREYYFRDEVMKREQLQEVLRLYLMKPESYPDSTRKQSR